MRFFGVELRRVERHHLRQAFLNVREQQGVPLGRRSGQKFLHGQARSRFARPLLQRRDGLFPEGDRKSRPGAAGR